MPTEYQLFVKVTISADNVRRELKEGTKAIRKTGYTGPIVAHISYDTLAELELSYGGQLRAETFSKNGVDTRIYKYDGVELIPTPDNLLVTEITTTENGWNKAVQLRAETFSKNGVDTRIYKYDGVELIPTPDNLLVTEITTTENGWNKAVGGKAVNFVMAAKTVPIEVNKCDKVKVFSPDVYQNGDDYVGQYRRYHDMTMLVSTEDTMTVG